MGIVREFQWPVLRNDQLENELPKKIFVQFDGPTIGNSLKESNGYVGQFYQLISYFKVIKDMEMWKQQCFQLF